MASEYPGKQISRGQIEFVLVHDGVDGNGMEFVYFRTNSADVPAIVAKPDSYTDSNGHTYLDDDFLPAVSVGGQEYECTDNPAGVDDSHQYEWMAVRDKGPADDDGNRQWTKYSGGMTLWSKWGQRGTDGDGVEYVFIRTEDESTVPTIVDNNDYTEGGVTHHYTDDDFRPMTSLGRATDDPLGVSEQYLCEWVAMRTKGAPNAQGVREWLPFAVNSEMRLWAKYGLDNDSIVLAPSLLALADDGSAQDWYTNYYTEIQVKRADKILRPLYVDHIKVFNDEDTLIYEATAEEVEIGTSGVYTVDITHVYSDANYPIMFQYVRAVSTTDPYGQPRTRTGNFLQVTRCTSLAANSGYFRVEVNINHDTSPYETGIIWTNPSPVAGSSSLSYTISHATDTMYGTQATDAVPLTVGSTTKDIFTQGSKQANTVLAAPNGSAGNAVFRALVEADIPTLSTSKISGLGTAATRGVATTIGPSITNLVPGSLLYSVLGDSFDSSNSVKDFINSSIATATADYKNNYNVVSDLRLAYDATHSAIEAKLGQTITGADNNDYCFVEIPTSASDPTQLARIERYKFNGTSWAYEYVLNNSSFTSAQWASINSGITTAKVSLIDGLNTRVGVLEARINWDNYFGIDNDGNIYVKKIDENTPRGFSSFGFITAGGVGTGGGGGGGDLDVNTMYINLANGEGTDPLYYTREINVSHLHEFWKSLQNNDIVSTYDNYKIAGAHIPDMAETYGYLKSADIDAYLQSLQSQIDSVAARTNFDDLVVTSLFSDVASVSSLYAETIYLGGTSIASSLSSLSTAISNEATARANADSGLSTAISNEATARANVDSALSSAIDGVASRATTLEGYFDANGNAKSALKLTTVSKTIWGQTYWTSGGVPQNVTAAPNLYIGGSKVQTSQAAQALVGISSISAVVSPGSDDNTKIEWDANANAWHFHGGIYADTFVTAGGEGSGGSVPTTLDAVWNTLRYNTGDYQDVQIDVAHIPGLPWSKIISGKPSSLAGYGILDAYTKTEVDNLIGAIDQFHYEIYPSLSDITTPAGNVLYLIGPTGSGSDKYEEYVYANGSFTKIGDTTIDLSAYLTITSAQATYQPIISDLESIISNAAHGEAAYNSLTTVSAILQSLQSQVDSVASRDTFDELTATVFYSDVAAVSDLYVGAVSLGGVDLAGSLSSLSSRATNLESRATALEGRATSLEGRATTLEGYFTNGVANSALRLSGTAAYSIWGVEYWSNGVPKSVTGRPGLYIGTTQVQTTAASQDLNGIAVINASGLATIAGGIKLTTTKKIYFGDNEHYLELDSNGFHFSHGLYSEGFVTAGGQGTGGGGGGVDLERVWQSLTNNTDFPDVKINAAHIPDMANVYGYLKGNQTITLAGVVTGSGTTSITTSIANNALSIAMVNGLQAALDSKTSNVGTVTSVGLSMPTGFSVSGTPITASGTFSVSFASGYSLLTSTQASTWDGKQDAISDLATIRSNASNGNTAYGWGNHANAGYFAASSFTASNIVSTLGNTAVNRATADTAGENIASNFTTVGNALKSLQSQIDSVASRSVYDELTATNLYSDMAVGVSAYFSNFYGNLAGTASNATNADNADKLDGVHASGLFTELTTSAGSTNLYITIGGTRLSKTVYAYYDSDGGVIASNMTTIGTALRSLQSQIDSVATNRSFDEMTITSAFVDMLSVGCNVNVGGTIHSIGGIDSNSYITAGATGSSSDVRLKDNIEEVSAVRAIELLSALKGKEWTWNDKKEYLSGKHGSGLIAQEVLPVMPWAVLDLNGEYSLNYNTLWGVAIPVMQSHEQRIEALERENKELKRKIEILTNNS